MDEKKRYEEGMAARRAVLGEAYVERSVKNRSDFNEEFQEMISRHAWGEIWTRPGLPRHTRSLLTIAMTLALNREEDPLACARRGQQRRDARRDQGSAAAGRHLLRRTGGEFGVSCRCRGVCGRRRREVVRR